MTDINTLVLILSISILGLIAFRDWGEMELDWQAKRFRIKRRQPDRLPPHNLDTVAEKSAPSQLPQDD